MDSSRPDPRVAMVAGEPSGDLLAGLLLGGMRKRWPGMDASGIGGPHMAAQGFAARWPHHKLAVHGFNWELIRRYREIVGIRAALRDQLLQQPPDVFVGVDAPDFNLDLERDLRAAGIPTVHFVSPSVWAWRPERMERIRASVDHVLCIFPFEPPLLHQHGIAATYVGHPLASVIPVHSDTAQARAALGMDADAEVVALLPGSRSSELRHLTQRFLQAARLVQKERAGVRFVLPAVPAFHDQLAAEVAAQGMGDVVQVLRGQSHLALAACDVTLIASGTATLEAMLFKRPMVIAYHMAWMSWQWMRRKRLQPWVGLPNILSGEFAVPELLQDDATPQAMAREVLSWLRAGQDDPARLLALQQRFHALHLELQRDTATIATDAIQEILRR